MPECYDSPINVFTNEIHGIDLMVREECGKTIIRTVQKIGIDIDEEGLTAVLNQDKKRYEEAYQKGWQDCEEAYKEKLRRIEDILGDLR